MKFSSRAGSLNFETSKPVVPARSAATAGSAKIVIRQQFLQPFICHKSPQSNGLRNHMR